MRLTLLLILNLVSWHSFANTEAPVKIDKVAKAFLNTINSKNQNKITQFVDTHFAARSLARWEGAGRERYIGYSMDKAMYHDQLTLLSSKTEVQSRSIEFRAQVQSKSTGLKYVYVTFFEKDAPHAITGYYFAPSLRPLADNINMSQTKLINEVSELTERLANNGVFSGTILLAKDDKVLYKKAYGLASRRYDVKNNLETKFQIGSMNKMFTSIAIMQLVEAGKVSLKDKLTHYIDRSHFGEGQFDAITIEQLLTHTSGLGDIPNMEQKRHRIRKLDDAVELYKGIKLNFEPGSRWRYSNTGMHMLGHVIETASKQSYYDFIDQQVYQKAHMQSSGSFDLDVPIKNSARSYWYSTDTGTYTENLMYQDVKGGPAGGGYSTVGDLHNFALALLDNKLVSKALTQQATSAKPNLNSPNYGYGFSVRGNEGNQIIGHAGSHLGMSAQLNIYRDKGYILAVLGNSSSATTPIVYKLNQLIERL